MSYEEYIDLLERLVEDGEINPAEAEILASRYDEFMDLAPPILPENVHGLTDALDAIVFTMLALWLYRVLRRNINVVQLPAVLSRLTYAQRVATFSVAQDVFQVEAAQLANQLSRGLINATEWHAAFNEAILTHYRAAAYAASGTLNLSVEAEALYNAAVHRQLAFASRFADEYVLSVINGTTWSEAYVASRSSLYAGALRELAYRVAEVSFGPGAGWVVYYIAVDDDRTCTPCSEAMVNGPYLMGQGPMPGEVCDGRGRCRCRREVVYDPDVYATLVP